MPDDTRVLVTVLLHHDQTKTLDEIMAHLRQTVRSLTRYMEEKAGGAFRYQVFPPYDFAPIVSALKKDHAS